MARGRDSLGRFSSNRGERPIRLIKAAALKGNIKPRVASICETACGPLLRLRYYSGKVFPFSAAERWEMLQAFFDHDRPRTRGECRNAPRPCPWVSCKYHLYLDVNEKTGAIKLNFPGLEVWELKETCALDVADRGGLAFEEVDLEPTTCRRIIASLLNIRRERVRQIEDTAMAKLLAKMRE